MVKAHKIIELSPSTSEITLIMNGLKTKFYLKNKICKIGQKKIYLYAGSNDTPKIKVQRQKGKILSSSREGVAIRWLVTAMWDKRELKPKPSIWHSNSPYNFIMQSLDKLVSLSQHHLKTYNRKTDSITKINCIFTHSSQKV